MSSTSTALTIAGSDPSGGAGLQADLKTFQQLGVYGMSVVTLVTVQNTQGVLQVEVLSPELMSAQLQCVLSDIPPLAIKTGALGNALVVTELARQLEGYAGPLVVDPVIVSKHGHLLASEDVIEAYKEQLLPKATLVTPNRFEVERITGVELTDELSILHALKELHRFCPGYVLMKFGELDGQSLHILSSPQRLDSQQELRKISQPRLAAPNTHGTGCILSAAICAKFALGETEVETAVRFGIDRTYEAILGNTALGQGIHPAETRVMKGAAPWL
ncbi:bifunctional hydroxymethylpyrimidine kinase/phosphomethylpyrimidine kinase [Aureliella helgolandensis]|uniref:hydroxymethylpyrimidine kinase n=1 Tax=Aureliella helgolandensis TaxID=2527968 RepID=A0A518GAI9_9BACT|nr:bifunctional hydroxymethylpyrimidine kinase/phosphomethylpyrimidine kinase [Aureliella helgolandensis]QDV25607.1 Hydroxymethylpyrimidine/phosphomethylpyrimidine kinase [Aureliella helgolandensis]